METGLIIIMPVNLVPKLHTGSLWVEQELRCSNNLLKCKPDLNHISFIIDLAEFVLNKCITQDGSETQAGQPVHYNFDYLEKTGQQDSPKCEKQGANIFEKPGLNDSKSSQNQSTHILYWMVSYEI